MTPLAVMAMLAANPVEWGQVLDPLRVGARPPASASGGAAIRSDEAGGAARGWLETGLLAALNAAGATPLGESGTVDMKQLTAVRTGQNPFARWVLAVDDRGRLTAALFRIPVPVDPAVDPPGVFSERRLHRLRGALGYLARYGLEASERGPRGSVLGWRARRHPGGQLHVRYDPGRDLLTVLLTAR